MPTEINIGSGEDLELTQEEIGIHNAVFTSLSMFTEQVEKRGRMEIRADDLLSVYISACITGASIGSQFAAKHGVALSSEMMTRIGKKSFVTANNMLTEANKEAHDLFAKIAEEVSKEVMHGELKTLKNKDIN